MHLANLFNVASYKHLFLCRSLVFHVGTPGDDFVEFFQEALVPWVHYVPVSPSLEDLEEKIVWAQEHDAEAQAIAQIGDESQTRRRSAERTERVELYLDSVIDEVTNAQLYCRNHRSQGGKGECKEENGDHE